MKGILLLILVSVHLRCLAQEHNSVFTSQEGGRFEIIQSPILRSLLFKLDKEKGRVFQYVTDSKGYNNWEEILVMELVPDTTFEVSGKNKYQLFMSGHSVKEVFLLNIDEGDTYQLMEDIDSKKLFFSLIVEPINNKIPFERREFYRDYFIKEKE